MPALHRGRTEWLLLETCVGRPYATILTGDRRVAHLRRGDAMDEVRRMLEGYSESERAQDESLVIMVVVSPIAAGIKFPKTPHPRPPILPADALFDVAARSLETSALDQCAIMSSLHEIRHDASVANPALRPPPPGAGRPDEHSAWLLLETRDGQLTTMTVSDDSRLVHQRPVGVAATVERALEARFEGEQPAGQTTLIMAARSAILENPVGAGLPIVGPRPPRPSIIQHQLNRLFEASLQSMNTTVRILHTVPDVRRLQVPQAPD